MEFDDFFGENEFLIDPEDLEVQESENEKWDTGIKSDIFATGIEPDIFTTKGCIV